MAYNLGVNCIYRHNVNNSNKFDFYCIGIRCVRSRKGSGRFYCSKTMHFKGGTEPFCFANNNFLFHTFVGPDTITLL